VSFASRVPQAVAPYVVACYHNPYEGIEELYIPSTVPYARSAFAHPLGSTYSNPREVSVDLPLRHGQVVDNNQLHTVQAHAKLTIRITRIPEDLWRKRATEYHNAPKFRVSS